MLQMQMLLKVALMYHLHSTNVSSLHGIVIDSGVEVVELVKFSSSLNTIYSTVNSSWEHQLKLTIEMFIFQNNLVGFPKEDESDQCPIDSNAHTSYKNADMGRLTNNHNLNDSMKDRKTEITVVVLFDPRISRVATEFMMGISTLHSNIYFLLYELGNSESPQGNIQLVISTLQNICNNIGSILIFTDNILSVTALLDAVVARNDLKLTGILHTTEWMVVSNIGTDLLSHLQKSNIGVDFMTVLVESASNGTIIAQKSRNELLTPKARVDFCRFRCKNNGKHIHQKLHDQLASCKYLRKNSQIYLKSKRSILSGMALPVCLFPDGRHIMVNNNSNTLTGYAFDLMWHLSTFLDFTNTIVLLNISGFYGIYSNGSATGLTGLLKNREIAFSTMPMSRLESRLRVIDYVPFVINYDPMLLIYRLRKDESQLDFVYIDIFKPDVYLLLIPVLALAFFGAVLHVTTQSCSFKVPEKLSKVNIRHFLSYHEHVCFTSSSSYRGQSGRCLQASWALTWFFLVSAYSTFLVTTFTTRPQELVINSLEKLLHIKDYKVGVYGVASGMLDLIEITELQVWMTLLEYNSTDPRTFSSSLEVHGQRVVNEKYVWITGDCANMGDVCEDNFKTIEDEIRSYDINGTDALTYTYIGIPQHTFYKDTLYKSVLDFEQNGILTYLRRKSFSTMVLGRNKVSKVNNEQTPVTFKRIQLPIYASLVGIGLGIVALTVEFIYQSLNVRHMGK